MGGKGAPRMGKGRRGGGRRAAARRAARRTAETPRTQASHHRVDRGARSSGPCRRWCGDTGCGVDLLATDEREFKELRQSRQKSITYRTRTATPPPAQKSSAKGWERIVRDQELSERSDFGRGLLCMCAGSAPRFSANLTAHIGGQGPCSARVAVCDRGGLMGCRCTTRGWARLVAAGAARIPAGARATPAAARCAWSRLTGKAAFLGFGARDMAVFSCKIREDGLWGLFALWHGQGAQPHRAQM